MSEDPSSRAHPDPKPVPDELLGKLHEANARFHRGRQQVEGAMDDTEYRHQERINQAEEELGKAEREVEEVERQIAEELNNPG